MDKKSIIPINLNNSLRHAIYIIHVVIHYIAKYMEKTPPKRDPATLRVLERKLLWKKHKTTYENRNQPQTHHVAYIGATAASSNQGKMAAKSNMGPHAQISGAPMPLHPPDGASPVGHTRRASGPHGEQGNQWMRGRPETSRQISTQQWYRG